MNELHLFAGAGGGILGGILLGHTTVCAVEIEPYCREVLLQRQRDGILPKFPIWDDVRTFDGRPWKGIVDVVCGGFPCQDVSVSNRNAQGIDGLRSGLYREFIRIIREVRPKYALMENSSALIVRGLGRVLCDLSEIGFNCRWTCIKASETGANHYRDRIWILAYPKGKYGKASEEQNWPRLSRVSSQPRGVSWWKAEPDVLRVDDGMAINVDRRNKAIGNGQVPIVAATAWRILTGASI